MLNVNARLQKAVEYCSDGFCNCWSHVQGGVNLRQQCTGSSKEKQIPRTAWLVRGEQGEKSGGLKSMHGWRKTVELDNCSVTIPSFQKERMVWYLQY